MSVQMDERERDALDASPRLAGASTALGALAILVGVAVLLGWILDIEALKRIVPGLVAMNPATACAFICAGTALIGANRRIYQRLSPFARRALPVLAAVILLVGLLKIIMLCGGPDARVDQWLFNSKLDDGSALPNRMAPNTALTFCLLGSALLLLDARFRHALWAAQILALVAMLSSLLALLGYAYGIHSLYGIGHFIPMALHTALVFFCLATGILLARGERGLMAPLTSYTAGGTTARRLLPSAVAVPALVGWLGLQGQRAGLFDYEFGIALFAVVNIAVFGALIWWNAGVLHRLDKARQKAILQMRETAGELAVSHETLAKKNAHMEADLDLAREIQQAFLPQQYITLPRASTPADSALRFHHRYEPTTALGGDFSDILILSDTQAGIFICDVMGHGVRSALVTAIVRGLAEETLNLASEPGQFLTAINKSLITILERTRAPLFASAFYLYADVTQGRMRYASAGHPSPFLARCDSGEVRPLLPDDSGSGPALGVFADSHYPTHESALTERDLLVLYTDGLTEAADSDGEEYGEERLSEDIAARLHLAPALLLDELLNRARAFSVAGQFEDDVCLVAMEVARSGRLIETR